MVRKLEETKNRVSKKHIALISIVLFAFLGGGMGAITKIGLQEIPPLSFVFLRFLIASIIILPFFWGKQKNALNDFTRLMPLSLLATGNVIFFTVGVKFTTATISQLLYAAVPLFTGGILYFFFREKLSLRKSIGILTGFVGVSLVILLPALQQYTAFSGNVLGNSLVLGAVLVWSFYMVFSRTYLKQFSPFMLIGNFIFVTTIVLFPFFIYELFINTQWLTAMTIMGVLTLFYAAIPGTLIGYVLSQYAIKHGGVVYASLTFYLQPVFAYLFAFVLLGEQLTTGLLLGAFFILIGITLVMKGKF